MWSCGSTACKYNLPSRRACISCGAARPARASTQTQMWLVDNLPASYLNDSTGAGGVDYGVPSVRRVPGLPQPRQQAQRDVRPPLARGSTYAAAVSGGGALRGRHERGSDGAEQPLAHRGEGGGRDDHEGDGDLRREGDGFVGSEGLSRKQRRRLAKRSADATATGAPTRARNQHEELGTDDADDRRHDDSGDERRRQRQCQEDAAHTIREAPFQPPPISRAQLVARVDALEMQGRQLAERRASNAEQRRHAEKLDEARKQLKVAGGYTAQKLQFELLGEQTRMRKAHALLKAQEEDLQMREEQLREIQESIADLRQVMDRGRARIAHAEARAAFLAVQVGCLGMHQQEVSQVHSAINEAAAMARDGPAGVQERLGFVARFLQRVAPVLLPPSCDPVVVDSADAFSDDCSDTDLDNDGDVDRRDEGRDDPAGDADGDFCMPAHIDVVQADLQRLRSQFEEAQQAARDRGNELLPAIYMAFQEKLRVAEARVAAASQVLEAQSEVENLLRRRAQKRPFQQRDDDTAAARSLPTVDLPPLVQSTPALPAGQHSAPGEQQLRQTQRDAGAGVTAFLSVEGAVEGEGSSTVPTALADALADGAVDIVQKAKAVKVEDDSGRRLARRCAAGQARDAGGAEQRTHSADPKRDVDMAVARGGRAASLDHCRARDQRGQSTGRGTHRGDSRRREKGQRERTPRGRARGSVVLG